MEEEFENNESINFQENIKNSQDNFIKESIENYEEENELDDDTFQYIANIKEIAKKDFSKYIKKELAPNKLNKNNLVNNLNFKYSNENNNEDISGISLLKELEEQWNNIEKQKNKNNKIDESTYSNTKSNNNNNDKLKYLIDMIEIKKNKFISLTEKNKKERNNDNELEQYFINKLKEMDKYKISDENLQKKIEIRQQEKNNEENIYNENNIEDNNIEDNNINNYSNEDTFDKKQYLQRKENNNIINQNKSPELEDLVYETPARINNNIILDNNYENEYENENEDNVNIGNISRPKKNIMSGKLFDKMKNLYQEINGDNKEQKYNQPKTNSYESGILGINNINLKENKYEENIILKNIRNNNNNENTNINDANKSINLNFNYINKASNINNNIERYNLNNLNKYIQKKEITNYNPQNNIILKDKDRMTLSGLQENFDDILKKVKSSHNEINYNKNKRKINLFEDNDEKEEIDKYFEELSSEAKFNLQKNKNISNNKNKKENKILKKIEENSLLLNNFMDEMNQNKNKFKQRILELNQNLQNFRNNENNYGYNFFSNNNY